MKGRIKDLLDQIDDDILRKLVDCVDDTDVGVPKCLIELYLKEKEKENEP